MTKETFKEGFEKQQETLLKLINGNIIITMTEIKKVQSHINDLKASLKHTEILLEENVFQVDIKIEKEYRNKLTKYGIIKDTKGISMDQKPTLKTNIIFIYNI